MTVSPPGQNASTSARTCVGTLGGERVEGGHSGDEHGRWRLAGAALRVEQALHGCRVERIRGDAVDGVGGQHDEFASADAPSASRMPVRSSALSEQS